MSKTRERSIGPASVLPRMLRIEYKGQPYDWFNLDEMGDIVRTNDFSNTLRENITHYFGVPYEFQAIYDEEGLLSSMIDFSRALRSVRPWLRVYDAREMVPDLKEKTTKQLEEIYADVMRSQQSLAGWGLGAGSIAGVAEHSAGSTAPAQQLFSSPGPNGQFSPSRGQRDPALSLADAVRNANEPGVHGGHYQAPQAPLGISAFPWAGAALEAYSMPPVGSSPRYPTPPAGSFHSQVPIPGMPPPQAGPGMYQSPQAFPMQLQQLFAPQSYGGGPPMHHGLPPRGAYGSSTPPMPMSSMAPPDVWRQPPASVGTSSTPPQPLPAGANAAAALAAPAEMGGGYANRPPVQRDHQAGSDQTGMIEVTLAKEPGFERFGFANVPTRDNKALIISWVDSAGLLQMRWNRLVDFSQQVVEGYRIVSVNGISENIEAMRDQLQMSKVQLLVQRGNAQPA